MGFSHAIVAKLGIPRRSKAAYAVHLLTGFALSAFIHVIITGTTLRGAMSFWDVSRNMFGYFVVQALCVLGETAVIDMAKRHFPRLALHHASICQRIGYLWTASWLLLTSWPFTEVYLRMDLLDWWRPVRDGLSLMLRKQWGLQVQIPYVNRMLPSAPDPILAAIDKYHQGRRPTAARLSR